jgi:hypothetical protein
MPFVTSTHMLVAELTNVPPVYVQTFAPAVLHAAVTTGDPLVVPPAARQSEGNEMGEMV